MTDDRRTTTRGRDRRREEWHAFRHAYPTFLRVTSTLFLLLVAVDLWLVGRRVAYAHEIDRIRAGMTTEERQRSDLIIRSEQDKLRMALELAKRQAHWDPKLHLSVAVDSGRMYLERDGALLRDMRVAIAPARVPAGGGDTMSSTTPRGQRTVVDVREDVPALVLNGGMRIYGSDDTTAAVTPGDVRVSVGDLKAILPNLSAGMTVYFY